jgi:FkbM family methyltransferase
MSEPPKFAANDLRICELLKSLGYVPDVIYDVGGSNGTWSRHVLTVYPDSKYEIFEPQAYHNPVYDQYLIPFVEKNPNVRLHTNLLADFDGHARLRIIGRNGVGASILGSGECESIPTQSRRLDTMIEAGDLPAPDLIKMDIQGAELMVLKGGVCRALPAASVLALELWLVHGYGPQTPLIGEVTQFLEQYGYYPFDFGDVYRDPETNVLIAQDVWYCRLGSLLSQLLWQGRLTPNKKVA